MGFKIPTLLQVKGVDETDSPCVWYAEAVGRVSTRDGIFYEAYYLVPSKTNKGYLVHDDTHDMIPVESVMTIMPVDSIDEYESAWQKMGMLAKDGTFLHIGDPDAETDAETDTESIGSVDSYSTESSGESDVSNLIDDTHEPSEACRCPSCVDLLRAYDAWNPTSDGERRVKRFIDRLEHRAAIDLNDNEF